MERQTPTLKERVRILRFGMRPIPTEVIQVSLEQDPVRIISTATDRVLQQMNGRSTGLERKDHFDRWHPLMKEMLPGHIAQFVRTSLKTSSQLDASRTMTDFRIHVYTGLPSSFSLFAWLIDLAATQKTHLGDGSHVLFNGGWRATQRVGIDHTTAHLMMRLKKDSR